MRWVAVSWRWLVRMLAVVPKSRELRWAPDRSVDRRVGMGLRRAAVVAMVQAADLWHGHDRAERGWRDQPALWRVFAQREMRSRLVVVRQVPGQDARQSGFIHDDHMIETLAPDGADDPLRVRVLPRGTTSSADLLNAMPLAVVASAANA